MRRPSGIVLALLSLALTAVPAGAAAPGLVVGTSIGTVKLGITESAVVARFGEPDRVLTRPNPFFGTERRVVYSRRKMAFTTGPDGERPTVLRITTRNRSHRTRSGVGIGSRRSTVARRVRGARCAGRRCHVGSFRPGRTVTTFFLDRRHRVRAVDMGYVLD